MFTRTLQQMPTFRDMHLVTAELPARNIGVELGGSSTTLAGLGLSMRPSRKTMRMWGRWIVIAEAG